MSELAKEILKASLNSQLKIEEARLYSLKKSTAYTAEIAIEHATQSVISEIKKQLKELA